MIVAPGEVARRVTNIVRARLPVPVAMDQAVNPDRPVGTGIYGECTYHRADDHHVRGSDAPIQPGILIVDTASELHQAPNLHDLSSRRPDKLAPA